MSLLEVFAVTCRVQRGKGIIGRRAILYWHHLLKRHEEEESKTIEQAQKPGEARQLQ